MTATHVATISPNLDLKVLDTVLGALEAALLERGAERVWVADGPVLVVMAELPVEPAHAVPTGLGGFRKDAREEASC